MLLRPVAYLLSHFQRLCLGKLLIFSCPIIFFFFCIIPFRDTYSKSSYLRKHFDPTFFAWYHCCFFTSASLLTPLQPGFLPHIPLKLPYEVYTGLGIAYPGSFSHSCIDLLAALDSVDCSLLGSLFFACHLGHQALELSFYSLSVPPTPILFRVLSYL